MIQLINAYKDKKKIENLYKFLKKYSDVCTSEDFVFRKNISGIVISGSERFISENEYKDEWIDFVRNSGIPILGICYGMQLISYSFGAILEKKERIKGLRKINIIKKKGIFEGLPEEPYLPESHYERVIGVSDIQEITAISKTGIEGIEIKERKVFGTQFHFERSRKYGGIIIKNFLRIIDEKSH